MIVCYHVATLLLWCYLLALFLSFCCCSCCSLALFLLLLTAPVTTAPKKRLFVLGRLHLCLDRREGG